MRARPLALLSAAALATLASCEKDTEHTRFAENVAEEMYRSSLVIETSSRNLAEFSAAQAELAARRGKPEDEAAFRASVEDARRHLAADVAETARRRGELLAACRARGLPAPRCEERAAAIEKEVRN